ncbi:MAG: transglycosylase domain-containing protein, partial [Thermoanaerobaculia bacterium]
GPGLYGAEAASRHYFGRPAGRLSRRQAAELAAALPRPTSWHPGSESRAYRSYVARIEARMEKATWLKREL